VENPNSGKGVGRFKKFTLVYKFNVTSLLYPIKIVNNKINRLTDYI